MLGSFRPVSAFLAWHVAAMFIGAIPDPAIDPLPPLALSRKVTDDPLAARVAPVLDSIQETIAPVPVFLWRVVRPFRRAVVDPYLTALNQDQRWSMFANPPTVDQYLRIRYIIATLSPGGQSSKTASMATELVLPTLPEDSIRTVRSYFASARDKAIALAFDDFNRAITSQLDRFGKVPDVLPDDLAPIGRYLARRFERNQLEPGERIIRIETWYAEVPNPPRGEVLAKDVQQARSAILRGYYRGPVRQTAPVSASRPARYGMVEREADLTWRLLYFEKR